MLDGRDVDVGAGVDGARDSDEPADDAVGLVPAGLVPEPLPPQLATVARAPAATAQAAEYQSR
ncbi:MAG: hypothetical protein ACLQFR_05510 [Streptosporangiaceae bacterium]